jgi:hypothetical protein
MPNGDGGGSFDFGGLFDALLAELADVIAAIIAFLQNLVVAIVNALNFLLGGIESTFGFSFTSLSEIYNGLKKLSEAIFRNIILAMLTKLWNLYKKIAAWVKKLKDWLDKLHAIMRKYQMMYFRRIIGIIQRVRKILTIFRFFHLKFATKLDNWLARIEGRIAHYLLLVASKTNEIIAWVNFIVDPLGNLKRLPLLAGFISALDATWAGIFGTPFSRWFFGSFGRGITGNVSTSFAATVSEIKTGTGDNGRLIASWPDTQKRFAEEMGVSK